MPFIKRLFLSIWNYSEIKQLEREIKACDEVRDLVIRGRIWICTLFREAGFYFYEEISGYIGERPTVYSYLESLSKDSSPQAQEEYRLGIIFDMKAKRQGKLQKLKGY